jgi:hypothetical protein
MKLLRQVVCCLSNTVEIFPDDAEGKGTEGKEIVEDSRQMRLKIQGRSFGIAAKMEDKRQRGRRKMKTNREVEDRKTDGAVEFSLAVMGQRALLF